MPQVIDFDPVQPPERGIIITPDLIAPQTQLEPQQSDGVSEFELAANNAWEESVTPPESEHPILRAEQRDGPVHAVPTDAAEANRAFEDIGLEWRVGQGEWESYLEEGGVMALDFLKRLKLQDVAADAHFEELQRAYAFNIARMRSPIADQERLRIVKETGVTVMGRAMQIMQAELGALRAKQEAGQDFDEERQEALQIGFAQLRDWSGRLVGGDLTVALAVRRLFGRAANTATSSKAEQRRAEADNRLLGDVFRVNPSIRESLDLTLDGNVRSANPKFNAFETHAAATRRVEAIEDTLGLVFAADSKLKSILRAAAAGAVRETRLRSMGISDANIALGGVRAALMDTHPELVARVVREATVEAQKRGDPQLKDLPDDQAARTMFETGLMAAVHEPDPRLKVLQERGDLPPDREGLPLSTRAILATDDVAKDALTGLGELIVSSFAALNEGFYQAQAFVTDVDQSDEISQEEQVRLDQAALQRGIERGQIDMPLLARMAGDKDTMATFTLATLLDMIGRAPGRTVTNIASDEPTPSGEVTGALTAPSKLAARRLQGFRGINVPPAVAREVLSGVLNELVQGVQFANVDPKIAEKTAQELYGQASKLRQGGFGDDLKSMVPALRAAVLKLMSVELPQGVQAFMKEPAGMTALLAGAYLTGGALGKAAPPVVQSALGPLGTALRRQYALRNLRKLHLDAIAHNPEVARHLKDFYKQTDHLTDSQGRLVDRRVNELVSELGEAAARGHRTANEMRSFGGPDIKNAQQKLLKTFPRIERWLKDLDVSSDTLTDAMRAIGVGEELLGFLRSPTTARAMFGFVGDFMHKVGFSRRKLFPEMRRRGRNVARELDAAVAGGADPSVVQSIPIPIAGTVEGTAGWTNRLLSRVPLLRRFYSEQDVAATSLALDLAKVANDTVPVARALAVHNQLVQGRQQDLVTRLWNKANMDLQDALREAELTKTRDLFESHGVEWRRFIPEDADDQLRLRIEDAQGRVNRLREVRDAIGNQDWRVARKLSQAPDVVDNASLGQIYNLALESVDGAVPRIWALAGRLSEDAGDFDGRIRELIRKETDAMSGLGVRDDVLRKIAREKKALIRKLYDNEGLESVIRFDVANDEFLPLAAAEKLVAKRRRTLRRATRDEPDPEAVAEVEANPELFGVNLGITGRSAVGKGADVSIRGAQVPVDPLPDIRNIRRWADTLSAENRERWVMSGARIDWNNVRAIIQDLGNVGPMIKNSVFLREQKLGRFFQEVNALPKGVRKKFDQALRKAAETGDETLLDKWFSENRDFAVRQGMAGDAFERLGAAFHEMEGLRAWMLQRMRDNGMIDDDAFETFIRPYAPHLYEADAAASLASAVRSQKAIAQEAASQGPEDLLGTRLFSLQKDLAKYKVQVRTAGQAWKEQRFATRDKALRFLRRDVGVRKGSTSPDDGVELFRTEVGDEVVLLDPVRPEVLEGFGLLDTPAALGKRLLELNRNLGLSEYMKLFDRPGWSLSEAEYTRRLGAGGQDARYLHRNFVSVPNSPTFGPLQGRRVHRALMSSLRDFTEGWDVSAAVQRELQDMWATSAGFVERLGTGLAGFADSIGGWMRKLIGSNAIQRAPVTSMWNWIWDKQATRYIPGVGADYLKTPEGRASQNWALEQLFGVDSLTSGLADATGIDNRITAVFKRTRKDNRTALDFGQVSDPSDPISRDAVEDGAFGDTFMGSVFSGDAREQFVKLIYGESGDDVVRSFYQNVLGQSGSISLSRFIRDIGAAWDSPIVRRLQTRRQKLRDIVNNENLSQRVRTNAGEKMAALDDAITAAGGEGGLTGGAAKLWNATRVAIGLDNRFGTFKQRRTLSNHMYTRLNNVHRLGVYHYMRTQLGYSRPLARTMLRKYMQDYSNLPGFVKRFRRSGLANPIFSFPYEFMRIQANRMASRPFLFISQTSAAPLISMFNMASAGHDPAQLWAFASRGSPVEGAAHMAGHVYLPNPDGSMSSLGVPQLNPLNFIDRPMGGIFTSTIDKLEEKPTTANMVAGAGLRIGAQFFGRNPAIDAFQRMTGTDPHTGRALSGGFMSHTAETVEGVSRMFVPGALPFMTARAEGFLDGIQRANFSKARGRRVTGFERSAQFMLGVQVRGGWVEQVADAVGAGRTLDAGTNKIISVARLGEAIEQKIAGSAVEAVTGSPVPSTPMPREHMRTRGIGFDDFFLNFIHLSARLDPDGFTRGDGNTLLDEMRSVETYRTHAERTDDAELAKWAEGRQKELRRQLERRFQTEADLGRVGQGQVEDLAEAEWNKLMNRARDSEDYNELWHNIGLVRQVNTLIMASAAGATTKELLPWAQRVLRGDEWRDFSAAVTGWSNSTRMRRALRDILEYRNDHPDGAEGVGLLTQIAAEIAEQIPRAIQREQEDTVQAFWNAQATREFREAQ